MRGGQSSGITSPLVAAIYPKIILIHRNHRVPWIQFAHPNKAKIGKVGLSIRVPSRQFPQLLSFGGEPFAGREIGRATLDRA